MNPTFLNVARQGRNGWKRYLLGILIVFGVAVAITMLVMIPIAYISGISIENTDLLFYGNPIRYAVLQGLSHIGILLGLFIAVKQVHKRKFMTLISPDGTIDLVRVAKGFILSLGLYGINSLVLSLIFPSRYSLTFSISEWLPFAFLALVFVPIVFVSTALFLYAYLLQGLGLLIRNSLLLSIVWGFILASLSFDVEMPSYLILDTFFYAFIAWIVIKDNRLELVIGLLLAQGFYFHLFVSPSNSLIQVPTVFKVADSAYPLLPLLAVQVFCMGLFYFICFGRWRNWFTSTPD